MNILARAVASTYGQLARWRVEIYEKGYLKKSRLKIPVISVGNLTFGGTGKTPVSHFLIQMFVDQGLRPAVASKSYKAKSKTIQKINPHTDRAEWVGDEALLLAQKFPQIPVYSGPSKKETAEILSQNENISVVIVDDGFQHLALHRDLDILLLDASENPQNYKCFPEGRARENLEALSRAQIFFLTKCNLALPEFLEYHRDLLKSKEVYEFDYGVGSFSSLSGDRQEKPSFFRGKKMILVSALAKPESFRSLIEKNFPGHDIQTEVWPDHHHYTREDINRMSQRVQNANSVIFTTEKDAVKLRKIKEAYELPIWQVQLELIPRFQVDSLYAKMSSFLA